MLTLSLLMINVVMSRSRWNGALHCVKQKEKKKNSNPFDERERERERESTATYKNVANQPKLKYFTHISYVIHTSLIHFICF